MDRDQHLPAPPEALQSTGLPTTSLREQSDWSLVAAIRSPQADPKQGAAHDAEVVRRCQTVLTMPGYFDPAHDERTTAGHIAEFVQALRDIPTWATHRAFDDWVRTRTRRPSPGDIVTGAREHMRPIGDEIAKRKREAEDAMRGERPPPTAEEKAKIAALIRARRFTPEDAAALRAAPLARSMEEVEALAAKREAAAFRHQPTPEQLAAARATSPINREIAARFKTERDAAAARALRAEAEREYDRQGGEQ